jgi:S1-C subfamily serine protease
MNEETNAGGDVRWTPDGVDEDNAQGQPGETAWSRPGAYQPEPYPPQPYAPAPPVEPYASGPYGAGPYGSGPYPPVPPAGQPAWYWPPQPPTGAAGFSGPGSAGFSGSASPAVPTGAATPKPPSGRGRILGLVLATALLSAALSGAGTYLAFTLTRGPSAAADQTSSVEAISLTQNDAVVRVVAMVKPSVVTITVSGVSGVSPFSVPSTGAGSGFIVSSDGLILTNNHVVTGAAKLTVTLDDTRQLPATVVATDATHDLALVRIDATGLPPVALGDSSKVQVGQLAIAIGSPLGTFTDSVTQGIVSGTDRSITVGDQVTRTEENLSGLIQTDAAINPGNSGGPLLDASGSAIGIITATASDAQGVGFAIPINQAKQLIDGARS